MREGARVVVTVEALQEAARAGTRPTPTPAPRRARSRRRAPPEAPLACTTARHEGCTAPAPPPMSRCAGSRPSLLTSCRTRRACYRTPTRAPRTAASTCAATEWAAATAAATVVATVVEVTEAVARAGATAAAAEETTVAVATAVVTAEEATAAATAAGLTLRPHSSARHAAPSSPRSWQLRCHRPAQPCGSCLNLLLDIRHTTTQASRRVHSRRHALQAAHIVCTTAHRTGRSGHSHPASLLSAGSHPFLVMSCRTRRTCYRRSSPAQRKSASTGAATAVTAEGVTAAATAGLLLTQRRAPSALAVR